MTMALNPSAAMAGPATSPPPEVPPSERLAARRATAFYIGEAKARRREISADAYLFLYKELVTLAGERTYCWPGLDYLAATLETSEGTIKRWLRELEQADLIQRKARPGGLTTLTYISAYLTGIPSTLPSASDPVTRPRTGTGGGALKDSDEATPYAAVHRVTEHPPSLTPSEEANHQELFFGSSQGINADRRAGSAAIPPTVKNQNLESGGCGRNSSAIRNRRPMPNDATSLLRNEGIASSQVINELEHMPAPELDAIRQYLDRQRNVVSRPGLFVWLARQNYGALLLRELRYLDKPGSNRRGARRKGDHRLRATNAAALQVDADMAVMWQQVLDRVAAQLPADDYTTWVAPSKLVEIVDNNAIVAVPNVFVRSELERGYQRLLEAALRGVSTSLTRIQIVIGPAT
jgi:hypothetical protein